MKLKAMVFMLLVIQSLCSAQLVRYVGAKVGVTAATRTYHESGPSIFDTDVGVEYHGGMDLGLYVEWFDASMFSLLTEIHYIQKGAEFVNRTVHEFGLISPRTDYLSVPVLAKARVFDQGVSPYIVCGPRVDFLIQTRDYDAEVSWKETHKTDFGATVGVGVEVTTSKHFQLGIEFRYDPDFTETYRSAKNRSMELLIFAGF